MSNEITGAEIVLKSLLEQGVEVVFGYPGGAVLPIYDSLFKQNSIRHVLVRQEGGAIHAAEGYARSSGKIGVVLVMFYFVARPPMLYRVCYLPADLF
jgi:acetolactate synthase-1/2/3 large subunit